jgi:hypothetical protein
LVIQAKLELLLLRQASQQNKQTVDAVPVAAKQTSAATTLLSNPIHVVNPPAANLSPVMSWFLTIMSLKLLCVSRMRLLQQSHATDAARFLKTKSRG